MKLDIDEREQWTIEMHQLANNCTILLDGNEVSHCTIADEEQGYIERYKTVNGDLFLNEDRTEVVREKLHGKVEIIDKRIRGILRA